MKIDIDRNDERKLFEAYYCLDTMLNGKDKLSRSALYQENKQLKQQLAEKEQDKISFALDQLEKVKNYIITDEKDMFGATYLMKSGYVLEYIDNQINELKEKVGEI